MEIIDYIIKNSVTEDSLKRKARQEKLASKVLGGLIYENHQTGEQDSQM